MVKNREKYMWWVLTGLAVCIVVFMHVYKICDIPFGLNVDEAGAAYDALNIARYGVDRWLNSYPVYFTNYGDGQNALYIYMTAILIKFSGGGIEVSYPCKYHFRCIDRCILWI